MFWRKKKTVEEPKPAPQPPRLTFEIKEGGDVLIACSWPKPTNKTEAVNTMHAYGSLVFLISTGKLLAGVQQAIANFAVNDPIQQDMARGILTALQAIMQSHGMISMPFDKEEPVVGPTEVFDVRNVHMPPIPPGQGF